VLGAVLIADVHDAAVGEFPARLFVDVSNETIDGLAK
jgi:hypothetical protein